MPRPPAAAHDDAERKGRPYLHAYADAPVIAGQGTVALEFVEDAGSPQLDYLLVAVGGGGLIAGMATAVGEMPWLTVVGIEPEGAANAPCGLAGRRARRRRPARLVRGRFARRPAGRRPELRAGPSARRPRRAGDGRRDPRGSALPLGGGPACRRARRRGGAGRPAERQGARPGGRTGRCADLRRERAGPAYWAVSSSVTVTSEKPLRAGRRSAVAARRPSSGPSSGCRSGARRSRR